MTVPASAEFDPWRSNRPLIVYVDFKSPYAFIAKDPTFALAAQLGIDVDWRPLTLDIPSFLGSARLDKSDRVVEQNRTPEQWRGVKYAYRDARRYARLAGYQLRGTVKIWDTSLVHIGMMWAKRHGDAVLARYMNDTYARFWRREFDAEDAASVTAALAAAGAETDGFDAFHSGPGRTEHDAMQAAIFNAGIYGVPGYVVDGEYFFGREHLPMVGWMLRGRRGPAPDVAYQAIGAPS